MLVDPESKEDSELEKNIKLNAHKLKPFIPACVMILIMFVIFKYWDNAVGFIGLTISASSGLILGMIIAFLVNIIMSTYENGLTKIFKGKLKGGALRAVGLITSLLTVILIIIGIIGFVVPELVNSLSLMATSISEGLPKLLKDLQSNKYIGEYATSLLNSLPSPKDITDNIQNLGSFVLNGASGAMGALVNSAGAIIAIVAKLGIGIFFSIYILIDKEKLSRQCTGFINTYIPGNETILALIRLLGKNFHGYIVAQVTDACILGCLCALGMTVLRLPYAVMSGVIIAFFALIPIIGAFLGMATCAFFILTVSPPQALIFLVFILTLQQIDNNIIYPRVVGNKVDLPGMWVLAAVTLFGGLFGIVGIMCSVPVTATIYQIVRDDYRSRVAKKLKTQKEKKKA
ncbi:MAG: AI-2E family transporter [Lachnospiraceae bacterium]|nr:AI-2E family transporter [Lachnospiraceae bacterium]